ncbi:MAG: DNA modification methylase [Sandaracinaceae bacterium]|nr:DNA modification methylase [Sandaracinaceae bacterium]
MSLPMHRWFRYSAGFSASWAEALLRERAGRGPVRVLDPFVGSGTTLLAADAAGVESVGLEAHPFVHRVAAAKLARGVDPDALRETAEALIDRARRSRARADEPPALIAKCFAPPTLAALERLRRAYLAARDDGPEGALIWLAITSILRPCANVGTAQWQYVLPNRAKARALEPYDALRDRVAMFADDLGAAPPRRSRLELADAREPGLHAGSLGRFDLVLTSPPYPNNYDYADATRLEMTFWREVERWADLHGAVRRHLIRSCSQHSAADKLGLEELLDAAPIAPIRDELARVTRELEALRVERDGRKTYHTMVAAYFVDLARVLATLRALTREDAELCLVIGDSAPYGVHVPVEAWLARLATSVGFGAHRFEKLRDRNTRWKNRKHRVPLHEGRLWIAG